MCSSNERGAAKEFQPGDSSTIMSMSEEINEEDTQVVEENYNEEIH